MLGQVRDKYPGVCLCLRISHRASESLLTYPLPDPDPDLALDINVSENCKGRNVQEAFLRAVLARFSCALHKKQ